MIDFTFDWYSYIETGIPKIDLQHQELFRIGRNIEQVLLISYKGLENEDLLSIICELRNYITYHFYEEETLMQKINYPEFLSHKQSHDAFMHKINAVDCDNLYDSLKDIKELLGDWFFNHILLEDHAINTFLKKK